MRIIIKRVRIVVRIVRMVNMKVSMLVKTVIKSDRMAIRMDMIILSHLRSKNYSFKLF